MQTAPFHVVKHFTKADTLEATIRILSHKLDSIEKIVSRNDIRAEFFHDNLAGQTTIFSTFVTTLFVVIGFISWKALYVPLKQKVSDNELRAQKLSDDAAINLSKIQLKLEEITAKNSFDIYKINIGNSLEQAFLYEDQGNPTQAVLKYLDAAFNSCKAGKEDYTISLLENIKNIHLKADGVFTEKLKLWENQFDDQIESFLNLKPSPKVVKLIMSISDQWKKAVNYSSEID